MTATAIGVDIGGSHLRAARVTASGEILARVRAPSGDPATVLERVVAQIRQLYAADVVAIGIGVPGRVDGSRGRVLSGGIVDLSQVDLVGRIEAAVAKPVAIENDCTMALVAEAAFGAARGCANVAMLTIGTGIGGAVIEAGRIVRGRASAGQLGHVTVDPRGLPCVCGRRGCVETESSGTALARHIAAAGRPAGTTTAALLAARDAGDVTAAAILSAWAGPLRVAIDLVAASHDPDLVVLGGGLGSAALAALQGLPRVDTWYDCPLAPAALGDDAGVIGAAVAALDRVHAKHKRVVLVNGVPASGKSTVALELAAATGWPVLALDTVKEPFLCRLDDVDRALNRTLGQASYAAIFAVLRDAPAGTTAIVDAWFGFQLREVLERHLAEAGIGAAVEIWCEAPAAVIGERYSARATGRTKGHPGLDYVSELVALAGTAGPLGRGPVRRIDTTAAVDALALIDWMTAAWRSGAGWQAAAGGCHLPRSSEQATS